MATNERKVAFQIPVSNAPSQVCNFDFLEEEDDFFSMSAAINSKTRKNNSDYVRRQSNVSAAESDPNDQQKESPTISPKHIQGKVGNFGDPSSFD